MITVSKKIGVQTKVLSEMAECVELSTKNRDINKAMLVGDDQGNIPASYD